MKNGTKPALSKSDYELGPQMPHSMDAERALLGAVLLDNATWPQTELLQPKDFYLSSHQIIFTRMMELIEEGKPIDFVTLTECLGMHKQIPAVGGVAYVTSLTDGLPRVKNIEQYVKIVKDKASLRRLIEISNTAIQEAYEQSRPAEEIIREADRSICEIQGQGKIGPRHAAVIVDEVKQEFARVRAIDRSITAIGLPTGLAGLDKEILGYHKGEMVLIAGETSSGKSTLMRQAVLSNVFSKIPTLVYTYEVNGRSFLTNLMSPTSSISGIKLRDFRELDEQPHILGRKSEVEIFFSHLSQVSNWPLWIEDNAKNNHIDYICSSARMMIRKHGIQSIWLDQASLARGDGDTETERFEDISKGMVGLAISEGVQVGVLSQLTRDKERQSLKRAPRKGDVKWAGRLEEDASTELFVWIDENGQRWIINAKQRNGAIGKIPVTLDTALLWFEDGYK